MRTHCLTTHGFAPQPARRTNQISAYLQRSQGFSLIEVLVSIVVLSFGLLGMAGMQAAALQANREARIQSTAVLLARELAEMIRGNKSEGVKTSSNPYVMATSSPLTPPSADYCLKAGAACTSLADVAQAEVTEWLARVDDQLPGARVETCLDTQPYSANGVPQWGCTSGTTATFVIKIGWTRGATDRSATGSAALEKALVPSVVFPVTAGSDTQCSGSAC